MTFEHDKRVTPADRGRRVVHVGAEAIDVTRLAPPPSRDPVTADDETDYVQALKDAVGAGLLPDSPPASFGRALARATTDGLLTTSTRIRTGIVIDLTDSANVAVIRTAFSPLTVLPGEQPRGGAAGGRPGQVREPADGYDADATRLGLRVPLFDDPAHLKAWCADALSRSLARACKRGRPEEIVASGVRRPAVASMALVQFADGTASQWVPLLSDGITRLAVCAAGLLDQFDADPSVAASTIVDRMLPVSSLNASSSAHELARRMRRNHDKFVQTYDRHVSEEGVDEYGVKIRQFLTVPADLHLLAVDPETGDPHPMESAMEVVVSDFHTGVDGWDAEDNSRHTALRALKRLLRDGDIDYDFFELCANRADPGSTGRLRPAATSDDATPSPVRSAVDVEGLLLRRAVTIMAVLLGPATFPRFKSALRKASGRRRLTMHQVVDFVAPLVCEPWGTLKPITRAWAYGGPVPAWIRETGLDPVHPRDYLSLVATALAADTPTSVVTAARLELALAGGTALIADGVLTTALVGGSGSATTPLPFRGPVAGAVEALTCTEEGLTALAVAANSFRARQSARTARLPAIDFDREDRVARDGVGVPVRITENVLAQYAAGAADAHTEPETPQLVPAEPTPLQNLQARARHLPGEAKSLLRSIELTKTLHDETGGPTGLTEHDLDSVHDSLSHALKLAGRLT